MGNQDLISDLLADNIGQALTRMIFFALIISKCPNGYSSSTKECLANLFIKIIAVLGIDVFVAFAEENARWTEEWVIDRCARASVGHCKKRRPTFCGNFDRIKMGLFGKVVDAMELIDLIKRLIK